MTAGALSSILNLDCTLFLSASRAAALGRGVLLQSLAGILLESLALAALGDVVLRDVVLPPLPPLPVANCGNASGPEQACAFGLKLPALKLPKRTVNGRGRLVSTASGSTSSCCCLALPKRAVPVQHVVHLSVGGVRKRRNVNLLFSTHGEMLVMVGVRLLVGMRLEVEVEVTVGMS